MHDLGPDDPWSDDVRPCSVTGRERSLKTQRGVQPVVAPAGAEEATMPTVKQAASEFLARKRVAVTGVSRTPGTHGSNAIYQRLRARGYHVFAINPNTDSVEGDPCYPDLRSVPGGVEAV